MPTTDELHAADQEHTMQIAELRARIEGHDIDIARHERHLSKLDEQIGILREAIPRVATKDDIHGLRADLREKFDRSELIEDRLDHYRERLDAMEGDKDDRDEDRESKHSRSMNWAMIGLFLAEIAIGIAQIVWTVRHA